jgi:two-component system osmolarity sensor histidine kinase EnvZ
MFFALNDGVLRVNAPLSRMTSHTSQLFFIWMVGASVVLLGVAIMFLRNQIRPILRLAEAADAFGRGLSIELEDHSRYHPSAGPHTQIACTDF